MSSFDDTGIVVSDPIEFFIAAYGRLIIQPVGMIGNTIGEDLISYSLLNRDAKLNESDQRGGLTAHKEREVGNVKVEKRNGESQPGNESASSDSTRNMDEPGIYTTT